MISMRVSVTQRARKLGRRLAIAFSTLTLTAPSTVLGETPAAKPLTPEVAVAIAIENNPSLAAVVSQLRSARASVASEEGRYKPTLLIDAGVTRSQNPNLTSARVVSPVTNLATAGAELKKRFSLGTDVSVRVETNRIAQQTLFNPTQESLFQSNPGYGIAGRVGVTQPLLRGAGRDVTLASLDAARLQQDSASRQRDQSASQLMRDVLLSYWDFWYAQQSTTIENAAKTVAVTQRNDTVSRVKAGAVAPVDVLQFETQIATRDESIASAELDERTRRLELERLLGQPIGQEGLPSGVAPTNPAELSGDLIAQAEERSPEIQRLKTALQLAETQAKSVADPYRSRLDLDAYVQAQGLTSKTTVDGYQIGSGVSAHVGVTYELPLAGGRHSAEVEKAEAAVAVARQNLETARQRLAADIAKAQQQLAAARKKLALSQTTSKIAEEQLAAEQARYRTGTSTPLQIVQAEDQVRSARLRIARARVDVIEGHISLLHLTGQLLEAVN